MQLDWVYIRQHGSVVYVGMVVVVYIYSVKQWKTNTNVLQSDNWANWTIKEKVCIIRKTMIPALLAKMHQHKDNAHVHVQFRQFVFSFFNSCLV